MSSRALRTDRAAAILGRPEAQQQRQRGYVGRSGVQQAPCRSRVLRVLVDEHGDAKKRAEIAKVAEAALVRRPAESLDVGLEVARRSLHVANPRYRSGTPGRFVPVRTVVGHA